MTVADDYRVTGSRFSTISRPPVSAPGPTAGPNAGKDLGEQVLVHKISKVKEQD